MKIAAFSHTYPTKEKPSQGLVIKNELDLLISKSIDIRLYTPQVISPFREQKNRSLDLIDSDYPKNIYSYFSIPKRKLSTITRFFLERSTLRLTDVTDVDIVHLHWLYPSGMLSPFFKNMGKKVVLTIHGTDWHYTWNKPFLKTIVKESLASADKIITVGSDLRQSIISVYPEFENKIEAILHGIDTSFFTLPQHAKESKPLKVLCVANVFHVKGIDVLLKAFGKLNTKEINLTIISSSVDPQYKKECEAIVSNLKIENKVQFVQNLTPKQLLPYYHDADFFVLPSRSEAFGLALAEAGSCGLPSISTHSGGPEEIVNSKTGVLVNPDSVDELYSALKTMLSVFKEYDRNYIREHIKANFSLDKKAEKLIYVYSALTSA